MTSIVRLRVVGLGFLSIVGQAAALGGCGSSLGGAGGTGGTSGSGGAGGGGAGVSGAAGAADASSSTRMVWQQVSCSVSRTECSGWVEDDGMGIDGTDVNCPVANLVSNSFNASICFQTPLDASFEEQQADAQSACATYCSGSGGFHGLYPLGALATVADAGVTCTATAMNDTIKQEINGQCSKVIAPSAGATALALCTLSGRACTSMMTAADGTQYCASMPLRTEAAYGCFDPTTTNAQDFCQHGLQFSATDGGAAAADEFAYWYLASVTLTDTPADCLADLAQLN